MWKIIKTGICLLMGFLPVLTFAQTNKMSPHILAAAEKGLKNFSPDYQNDLLNQGKLLIPFKLFTIEPPAILSYQSNSKKPIKSYLTETTMWYFPISLNDTVKAILIVDSTTEGWKAVSLGHEPLAGEIQQVLQDWPLKKGFNPLIIAQFQSLKYMFTVPEIDNSNLTIINYKPKQLIPGRYSKLDILDSILRSIKAEVEENLN